MALCYSEAVWTSKTQCPALAHKKRVSVGRAIRPEEKADSFLQMLLADVQAYLSHTVHGWLGGEDCRTKHGKHSFVNVQRYKNDAACSREMVRCCKADPLA